jgi:uncharacterized membrane protein
LEHGYEPDVMPWRRADLAAAVVLGTAMWSVWCTLFSRAQDRVLTLKCAENYAVAVYDQLLWNFTTTGAWSQNIHFGYQDAWDWSGHLALWIFPISGLYALWPGPNTLLGVQTAAVVLGAAPMYVLGRRAFAAGEHGSVVGGLVAGLGFLAWPALWGVALADYQDLVIGVPFLIGAYAASQRGSAAGMMVLGLLTCAAREEWLFLVPFVPLAAPGGLREKLRQAAVLLLGLLPYAVFLVEARLHGTQSPHAVQPGIGQGAVEQGVALLLNRGVPLDRFLQWPPPFTRSAVDVRWFYAQFLEPLGWLAMFSPSVALPTAIAWFMHACSPPEGGVDARWVGHIHHMAPINAFLGVGATLGAARLLGGARRLWERGLVAGIVGGVLTTGLVALVIGAALDTRGVLPWLQLHPRFTPSPTVAPAPEWALLQANVPPDAAIATDPRGSLLISTRSAAYTYNESLAEKSHNRNLSALDYVLVRRTDIEWLGHVRGWSKARKLGETAEYELYALR